MQIHYQDFFAARMNTDLAAIRCGGKDWSYRVVDGWPTACGCVGSGCGCGEWDRVGLYCINSPYFCSRLFRLSGLVDRS